MKQGGALRCRLFRSDVHVGRKGRRMNAYTGFAAVYDMFMDNIPYEEWCKYLITLLKRQGITDGLVLDMGCGTGSLTRLLAKEGYDMIGIDRSGEMLEIAMEHQVEESEKILYLQQDMREFELYGTVRAVISICDSINYIMKPEELVQVFSLVNNYLDPGGIFIFDCNTLYKYEEVLGDQTIAENRDEGSFIWENYYEEETGINEYQLTLFIREEDGRYCREEEIHYQRAYSLEQLQGALELAGLEFVAVYDAFTEQAPTDTSERIYIIAREQGKINLED